MGNVNQTIGPFTLGKEQPLRFELIELYVDANSTGQSRFTFPTMNNLQNKRVLFVEAYSVEVITTSPTNKTIIPVSVFKRSVLTLYTTAMDKQNIQQIPFSVLNVLNVPAGTTPFAQERLLLNNPETDWNKCFIETGAPIGVGNVSFLLGVYYVDK